LTHANPTLTATDTLEKAVTVALDKVAARLTDFTEVFPDDATVDNTYQPRAASREHPETNNIGWTTGFWTGTLWLAYDLSGNADFRDAASAQVSSFARRIEHLIDCDHHDLGFLYSLSCVAADRLTGNALARQAAQAAAAHLMTRYLEPAGVIQAWGDLRDPRQCGRMIVDGLMNLPLLYWSGDAQARTAACRHAEASAQYLMRSDGSTYHTFYFDGESGQARFGQTHQGASDDSCWARGQAWAVYGFALNHRYAPHAGLLSAACRAADYFLAHLPTDRVAYWDLSFRSGSDEPRDSSASAILACGLLELAGWLPDTEATRYRRAAHGIVAALIEHCATRAEDVSSALLLHGVYHRPHNLGVDEANLWGDYFYLEALVRCTRKWTPYW